jgi:uncharacterized protein (TIGR02145 family)
MRILFSKFALAATLGLALAFIFSCSGGDDSGGGSDKGNDIANYKTIPIGDQVWMAENLNYNVSGSKCYNNKPVNCDKYGRLYDWATAMGIDAKHQGICPVGWHIPSDADWNKLINFVGNSTKLKAQSGWNDYEGKSGNGTDEFGFLALPSGNGYSGDRFYDVGISAYWWSSSWSNSNDAHCQFIEGNGYGDHYNDGARSILCSVRCVQD